MKEEQIALLQKEVESLVQSFSKKRKQYEKMKNIFQMLIVCMGALVSLSLGLSFISEIEFLCKVIGIVLSAAATIITGISNLYNYEQRWRQRSVTYLKLLELKRDLKFEAEMSEEKFTEYRERLNIIMRQDAELWLMIIENQQEKNTLEKKD